jgi:hypothetical protein
VKESLEDSFVDYNRRMSGHAIVIGCISSVQRLTVKLLGGRIVGHGYEFR